VIQHDDLAGHEADPRSIHCRCNPLRPGAIPSDRGVINGSYAFYAQLETAETETATDFTFKGPGVADAERWWDRVPGHGGRGRARRYERTSA
jgi:hypothetical protein